MSAIPAQGIFDALHGAGLSVSFASGGGLAVSPGSRLTPALRELVKGNKAALLDWLQAANDPSQVVGLVAVDEVTSQQASQHQPTDPNAWRDLAAAYHAHHFKCRTCTAAGLGDQYRLRCGVGAALWRSYSE